LENNYVIESIRTEGEINELKKLSKFNLVFIDADEKTRYQRAKERLKEKETMIVLKIFWLQKKRK
jgi:dephospho-CoA kinase